jgi:acyl-CoA reductase-like NAD-dependent aldehyde dehydrogenase
VLKPSPFTSLTTLRIGELLREVLPPGVLNVVSGGDALGPWMSSHPGIDKISFTGSTATGRKVMESAAGTLKRLTLELGGNDAAIVMPDVDVEALAPVLFWGAFSNSAQFCLAIKRLYIHEAIYDRLAAALVALAKTTRVGRGSEPGVTLGPVQNKLQYERLKNLLADCRQQGHHILTGGELAESGKGPGYFFPVTLVDNPPEDSRVVQEEPFGPILPLLKFSDVDDAIARANQSPYGLGGSVWCKDEALGLKIAQRLQAGTVWVNEIHTITPLKPMAGHKQSGLGVEQGLEGLLEYTLPQTVSMKRATA